MGTKDVRRREVYWRKRAAKRIEWGLDIAQCIVYHALLFPTVKRVGGRAINITD